MYIDDICEVASRSSLSLDVFQSETNVGTNIYAYAYMYERVNISDIVFCCISCYLNCN